MNKNIEIEIRGHISKEVDREPMEGSLYEQWTENKAKEKLSFELDLIVKGINLSGFEKIKCPGKMIGVGYKQKDLKMHGTKTTNFDDCIWSTEARCSELLSKDAEKVLIGKPVVDLGSAGHWGGLRLASIGKASGYISVDIEDPYGELTSSLNSVVFHCTRVLHHESKSPFNWLFQKGGMERRVADVLPLGFAQADLLFFLKQLPDKSANVFTFGLDRFLFHDEDYISEVKKEIDRVVPDEGGMFGNKSGIFIPDTFYQYKLYPEQKDYANEDIYVYRKKEKEN